ncbi:MAG: hypothetical protein ACRDD7_00765 [Peptostreptococcaceae bacterium]
MKECIGIIITNQWEEILLYDHNFYIKVSINENEDIEGKIKEKIKEITNKDFYKIKKIYDEKIEHYDYEIKLYVIEICEYTKDFEFMTIQKLENEILNFQDKEFFQINILKYEEYSTLVSTIFNFGLLIFFIEGIKNLYKNISIEIFLILLIIFVIIITIFNKYAKTKIEKYIINKNINTKLYNYVLRILIFFYCMKFVFLVN